MTPEQETRYRMAEEMAKQNAYSEISLALEELKDLHRPGWTLVDTIRQMKLRAGQAFLDAQFSLQAERDAIKDAQAELKGFYYIGESVVFCIKKMRMRLEQLEQENDLLRQTIENLEHDL
jgi:hypothetical protein